MTAATIDYPMTSVSGTRATETITTAVPEGRPRDPRTGKFLTAEEIANLARPVQDDPADEAFSPTVFTNVRNVEETVCLTFWDEKRKGFLPTGETVQFNSTKLIAQTPEQVSCLRRSCPYAYEEPSDYLDLASREQAGDAEAGERFFRDARTGFKTLRKDAYEAWMNSQWRPPIDR